MVHILRHHRWRAIHTVLPLQRSSWASYSASPPCAEGWLGNFGVYQSGNGMQRTGADDAPARASTVGRIPGRRPVYRKQRPDVRAALPAHPTSKLRLHVGESNVVRPRGGVDRHRMRALVVAAVDEQPARAGRPHFSKGDLLFT